MLGGNARRERGFVGRRFVGSGFRERVADHGGAADAATESTGFGRGKRDGEDREAIKRLFTPEFRNRLDAVVPFSALSADVVGRVVEKFVLQLEVQLGDRNVTFELSPEATNWLAERGYDEAFGARPLARLIQESIKKPLAEEILFGRLLRGGTVKVMLNADKSALAFEIIEAPQLPASMSDEEDDLTDGEGSEPKEPELVK